MENVLDIPAKPPRIMMHAAQTLLIAMPVNSRLNADICLRFEKPPITRVRTANAPASAPIHVAGMPHTAVHPAAMTTTAPSDAPVLVVSLAGTSPTYRGATTFYYDIELDGKRAKEAFSLRLPIGKYISVLTLPGHPDVVELGDKQSSLFAIFSNQLGSTMMGLLALSMFCFMIVMAPKSFLQLWKERPHFLGGPGAN